MSRIKFKHVFAALLALSAISAFILPERFTTKAQPQVQGLFYPVARPVRSVAGWVDVRFSTPTDDGKTSKSLREENESLKQDVITLSMALVELQRRNDERESVGRVREFCQHFPTIGTDAAGREGLLLKGSTLDGLKQGQYAVYWGGVVGTVDRAGVAGAEVRLITDIGFRVGACFLRPQADKAGKPLTPIRLSTPNLLLEGVGGGAMRCVTKVPIAELNDANVEVGDWAFVEETEWDHRLQGYRLGKVTRIAPQPTAPLYADIRIEPATKLTRLPEVMVMTK
jgi:cell shape-determining protein MreC